MGDLTTVTTKSKDGGLSSFSCLTLNSANYTVWAIRMKFMLKLHKIWDIVEEESTDAKNNNTEIAVLFQSLPETLILQVGELDTAKKFWEIRDTWVHIGFVRLVYRLSCMNSID